MASIERRKTKDGEPRWDVRHRVGPREVSRTFRTRSDAVAYRRQIEHDALRGTGFDPRGGTITLDDWWAIWWPLTANLRASTRARDEAYYKARIKPTLGDLQLVRIDRAALRAWIAELRAAGLASATVVKAAQILSKTLRAAVDDGRLGRNAAEKLELPPIERQEMRFLDAAQVGDLADAIQPAYRALVILGAYGGLRLGEMLALRRDRVNLLHAHVEVAETVATVRGQLIVNPPKPAPACDACHSPASSSMNLNTTWRASTENSSFRLPRASTSVPNSGVVACGRPQSHALTSCLSARMISGTRRLRYGSPLAHRQLRSPRVPVTRAS